MWKWGILVRYKEALEIIKNHIKAPTDIDGYIKFFNDGRNSMPIYFSKEIIYAKALSVVFDYRFGRSKNRKGGR